MPLGEDVSFDPLEPADDLVRQAANLGEVAGARPEVLAEPVLDRLRQARLEARRSSRRAISTACRARSSVASKAAGSVRPAAASSIRCCARAIASMSTEATIELGSDGPLRARLRAAAGADRAASGRAAGRVAAPRVRARDRCRPAPHLRELPDELHGRLVVVNDTKVVPARIPIASPTRRGAAARAARGRDVGGARAPDAPAEARAAATGRSSSLEHLGEGRWRVRLDGEPAGETPLPPYITEPLGDASRYQTVYAREPGSAAAPTAGLHFTPELLERLDPARVTLHVGLDTFRPVNEERLEEHRIHGERYEVEPAAWERIRAAERVLAVGTTTVRVLETLARGGAARRPHRAVHHAGLRVPARRRAPHELPPAALDAARPRDGVRGDRGDAPPLPARDRGAVPLLLVRRCDAHPLMFDHLVMIRVSDRDASAALLRDRAGRADVRRRRLRRVGRLRDRGGGRRASGPGHLHVGFAAPSREEVDAFWRRGSRRGLPKRRRAGVAAAVPARLLRRLPPRPGRQQRRGGAPARAHRDAGRPIDHLWLGVADLGASRRFYETIAPVARTARSRSERRPALIVARDDRRHLVLVADGRPPTRERPHRLPRRRTTRPWPSSTASRREPASATTAPPGERPRVPPRLRRAPSSSIPTATTSRR